MTPAQLSDLLYAIGMESPSGWAHMQELCAALGVDYPPKPIAKQDFEVSQHL